MFAADMILRYIEKISEFGLNSKRLIKFKGKTVPYEFFFPNTIIMMLIALFVFGLSGLLFHAVLLRWYLSVPFSVLFSLFFCFAVQYPLHIIKNAPPRGEQAAGIEGFAVKAIPGDSYGLIEFEYKGVTYQKNAISEYETYIPEFERVIILFEENDVYIVESITEVYNIFEE
jgi:energy-coupling factor transporter transmembrane protein EcfT